MWKASQLFSLPSIANRKVGEEHNLLITPSWASLPADLVVAIYAARTTQPDGPLVLGTKDR